MTHSAEDQGPSTVSNGAGHTVDCSHALSKLFEFLDSEMAEQDCDRIREHLADCEPCLNEYDIEDHLKKLVKRSCHDAAPMQLHLRIREQLVSLQSRAATDDAS